MHETVRPVPEPARDVVESAGSARDVAMRELRTKAEKVAEGRQPARPGVGERGSPESMERALHELLVHRIELEMQNGELRQAQVELEAARARYYDLYELAPVGYVTVDERGMLLEANLPATIILGAPRSALVGQAMTRFISREDQDAYYLYRGTLLRTRSSAVCRLGMHTADGKPFRGRLEGIARDAADGSVIYRIILSDVTDSEAEGR